MHGWMSISSRLMSTRAPAVCWSESTTNYRRADITAICKRIANTKLVKLHTIFPSYYLHVSCMQLNSHSTLNTGRGHEPAPSTGATTSVVSTKYETIASSSRKIAHVYVSLNVPPDYQKSSSEFLCNITTSGIERSWCSERLFFRKNRTNDWYYLLTRRKERYWNYQSIFIADVLAHAIEGREQRHRCAIPRKNSIEVEATVSITLFS